MAEKEDHSEKKKKEQSGDKMTKRGVTRPMAQQQIKEQQSSDQPDSEHQKRLQKLHMHHKQTLWVYWSLILIGLWMIAAPFTFGYAANLVMPSGGREVWLSLQTRVDVMIWSDIISGILLIFFGWRALTPNRPVSLWAACFVGIWLSMAPVIFWAPSAAAYLNDTIAGALVIAFTILIPGMPNMIMYMRHGPSVPTGWSYNPSSWPQRGIMIGAGFFGWMVSRYLAAFQLGYIDTIWDPFFGEQSRQVLNSKMSHMWPISDAALGAFSYTFEFLMGFMGAKNRWRTMPWMVTFFGILVIPLGLTHILLVISQPVVVGQWCTFCLLAALIMLPMIPLEIDEVIAMGQFLVKAKRKGRSLWKAFWLGGTVEGSDDNAKATAIDEFPQKPAAVIRSSVYGMSVPWNLLLTSLLGIWLMFGPWVFGMEKPASAIYHLGGALVVTTSVISMGEVIRTGRYFNLLLAVIIILLPWFLGGSTFTANLHASIVGAVIFVLSFRRGPILENYGEWQDKIR